MAEIVAYVLLIDGISTVFTTSEDVTDAHVAAWGFTTAYPGLHFPTRLQAALDLREGVLQGTSASFDIHDIDGTLPGMFAVSLDDTEALLTRIEPGDTAPNSTWGKQVGIEAIGAAGQRRRYSCVPGWNVGLFHLGEIQASAAELGAAPVSDDPVVWAGRRCCLHRIVWDGSAWSDLTDETTRNQTRVWFGTLLGQGEHDEHVWSLTCAGPESWVMGTMGAGFSAEPLPIEVETTLDEEAGEHVLRGRLVVINLWDPSEVAYTYVANDIDSTSLAGATSYDDFVTGIQTALAAWEADASSGQALSAAGFSSLDYFEGPGEVGFAVRFDRDSSAAPKVTSGDTLLLGVRAHRKVWMRLGYDPQTQNATVDPVEHPDKYGRFWQDAYAPGFWWGNFYSADATAMLAADNGENWQYWESNLINNGQPRVWPPIYGQGANYFDMGSVPQVFRVTGELAQNVFIPASNAFPLPADPDDPSSPYNIPNVGDVTHAGLVAFSGPYRDETDPDAEVEKMTLVARVAWRQQTDGSVALDNTTDQPTLVVYDWPDPRLFGLDAVLPQQWGSWRVLPEDGGEALQMRVIYAIEHSTGADTLGYVLARLMASTGTAGEWYSDAGLTTPKYGLEGERYLDVGTNDLGLEGVGDQALGRYTDADVHPYALGVPSEMIAAGETDQTSLAAAITLHAEAPVYRCKAVLGKPVSTRDLFKTLLAPTGWCMSLAGGKFGLFDPFEFKAPLYETGQITAESLAGKPGDPRSAIPTQRLRVFAPIDRIDYKARLDPVTGKYMREGSVRSSDPSTLYRSQSIAHAVDGAHLVDQRIADWVPSFNERWKKATTWWSRQHFECEITVPARRAHEFWPGSQVEVSNEWLVNPAAGVYGVTAAPGYVVSRTVNAKDETCRITCIVSAASLVLYAPSAIATRYDENDDAEGYRIFVNDDHLGIRSGTGTFDVDGFVEPEWSTLGGNADIEVFSFDGVTWTGGIYGTVSSVNASAGNCYITLTGALTGATWLRDQHHLVVLRDAENQSAAWPFGVYAPIGNKSGNYTGSTKTKKFKDS